MFRLAFERKLTRPAFAAGILVFLCCCVVFSAATSESVFYLSVYPPDGGALDPRASFSATIRDVSLLIRSATPSPGGRPVLVIADPGSYGRVEIRRRVAALAKALSAYAESRGRGLTVRMGIPVLDGILSDPLTDPKDLGQAMDRMLDSYFPDSPGGTEVNFGRTLDLIAALVRRADQEGGGVDCLILARDRRFAGEEASYLSASSERQFLDLCLAKGSTLHAYPAGGGALREICLASGGYLFEDQRRAEEVAELLLEAQSRRFLLAVARPEAPPRGGRHGLTVQARLGAGKTLDLRAPSALWVHPSGSPVPDQYHVRQSLDWLRRAKESQEDQNLTSALRFLDNAIQEDSWNTEAFYLGGRVASDLGDYPLAESYLTRAVQLGNPDERTLTLFGRVYEKQGKSPAALETIQANIRAGVVPSAALKRQMARLLSSVGRNEEASKLYAELIEGGQGDDASHAEYGAALWSLRKASLADEHLRVALARNPKNVAALITLSEMALAQGLMKDASEWAQRAVQASPRDADAQVQMGKVRAAQGEQGAAAGHYRTAHALAPARRDLVDLLVQSLAVEGKFEEATEVLRRTLEQDASDVNAYRSLAQIQARSGKIAEAVTTLEKGAAQASRHAHVLFREAAELRERRGEYGQALLDYRAMLRSSPPELSPDDQRNLLHHLSFLSRLLKSEKRPAGSTSKTSPVGMIVPGGHALLARTLGVDPALLKEPDATERMIAFMLEVSPSHSDRLQDNPIRRDVFAYLRNYDALLKKMRKDGLLPAEYNPTQGHEFVFPLIGEDAALKRTKKFLSFFGVGFKSQRSKDGNYQVMLNLKQNRGASERQQLLRNLGINLLDRGTRELRFSLRDEELPLLFDSETWSGKILAKEKGKSKHLLGRLVSNARALRLYLALAGCSDSTRAGLLQYSAPGELMDLVDAVSLYGRYIEFRKGTLVLPGSSKAWEALAGAPPSEPAKIIPALLRLDHGRPMLLYYALTVAPDLVQRALTATPERLAELYQILPIFSSARGPSSTGASRHDLGRLLRQLTADDQELMLELDQRFGKYLLSPEVMDRNPEGNSGGARIRLRSLTQLWERGAAQSSHSVASVVEVLEFIRYLQSSYSEVLEQGAIDAIMQDLAQTPVFLDIVWDLRPPSGLLVKYLAFCRQLAGAGLRGWNENRTRTCQSLFHVIALLCREGSLARGDGVKLLASALEQLSSDDEGVFALQAASFISEQLLPALARLLPPPAADAERLLQALAGPSGVREFAFEGRQLQFDPARYRLQRMKGAIQQQRHTPLSALLDIYKSLRRLQEETASPRDLVEGLKNMLARVQSAEFPPETPSSVKQAVAFADAQTLLQKMEPLIQRSGKSRNAPSPSQLASEISAALHTELGVTLLTYCYAYHGAVETDALAFDPNFVRKHAFYDRSRPKETGWIPARLDQKEGVGACLVGSLSGLSFELSNLETAQSAQTFGRRESRALVPTILSAMRAMQLARLSNRAQEYVALSVRAGREALALSGVLPDVRMWSEKFLNGLVPPKRRERIFQMVLEGNPNAAGDVLSPSELFLLGEAFASSGESHLSDPEPARQDTNGGGQMRGTASGETGGSEFEWFKTLENGDSVEGARAIDCPVVRRLREIVPDPSTPEAERFKGEVQQYGVLLRRRLGLNQLSLSIADSYEQLETSAREELLFERLCDLKIRLAEIGHATGLPAYLSQVLGELAIRDILPRTAAVRTNSWRLVLEQIGRLGTDHARSWVDELLNRGILEPSSQGAGDK